MPWTSWISSQTLSKKNILLSHKGPHMGQKGLGIKEHMSLRTGWGGVGAAPLSILFLLQGAGLSGSLHISS